MHPLLFCSKTIRIKTHNGVPLGIIKEEKDLGVFVSQDLKVGKQSFKAASKGNQVLGMIKRTFTKSIKRDNDTVVQITDWTSS